MPHAANAAGDLQLVSKIAIASLLAQLSEPPAKRRRWARQEMQLAKSALDALFPVIPHQSNLARPEDPGKNRDLPPKTQPTHRIARASQLASEAACHLVATPRGRTCECGIYPRSIDNSKWDRVFEKFVDPSNYHVRHIRHDSTLSGKQK